MFSCLESGQNAIGIVGILVSIISIVLAYYVGKHYSGNVQIVKNALDQVRLGLASDIIQEISKDSVIDANLADFKVYLEDTRRSATLKQVFHDFDLACAIVKDNAIPLTVRKSANKTINDYLSRVHVLHFVTACGDEFPALQIFAKKAQDNWGKIPH